MHNSKFQIPNLHIVLVLLLTACCLPLTADAQIAVKGETVWTMAGEPIRDGVVLLNANGKIEAVGAASQVKIPANYRVVAAKVVTPGLIDAHTVIGLNGYLNQPQEQMALDGSSPMQPELRAIDAYNPLEKLIEWVRSFGVTTIHTGHQPSALVSGQTMVAKTVGNTADEATLIPTAMIAVTLGESALGSQGRSPGTRGKQAAMLRAELVRASEAVRKADGGAKTTTVRTTTTNNTNNRQNNNDNSPTATNPNSMLENPPTENNRATNNAGGQTVVSAATGGMDLRSEAMQRVVRREIPLLVTAHRAQDIITAIRIAKEFNIRIVLDGVAEAQMVLSDIKASGFPVIVHPTMYRAAGETENLSMEDAAKLKAAGIPVALQSGYESYVPKTRVVLFEAGVAAGNGVSQRDALAMVTIDAAKIIGLDSRLGSLVKGKDADIAMFDGDPFEYSTHCTGTIINGKIVSEVVR